MTAGFDKFAEDLQNALLDELRAKYAPAVIEHWMHPRNLRRLAHADGRAVITGPCGDTMEIYVRFAAGRIAEATFFTDGCGTSIACGDTAAELAKGKSLVEAISVRSALILETLGGLPPEDKHCAVLAAHTLQEAIANYRKKVKEGNRTR